MHLIKVNLPRIVSLGARDFDHAPSLDIGREVKDVLWGGGMWNEQTSAPENVKKVPVGGTVSMGYLMKTRVLHVVRRPLLLSFNLYAYLKANGARHR